MRRSVARDACWRRPSRRRSTRTPPKPLPLWRFFLVAAFLVIVAGTIVFARRGGPPDLRISARVGGTPTPTAQRPGAAATSPPGTNFIGSGSWALSSLPSCFHERDRLRGPAKLLRARFPAAGERLRPASVVRSGDCTIVVGEHDLWVARGNDRLRVPPDAALFRGPEGLTLVSIDGAQAEIRRY